MPRPIARLVVASGALSLAAVLGHYDVAVGDYIGDRVVVASLLLQPAVAFLIATRGLEE